MSKIKEMLKSILVQLGEVNTDKGILTYDGDLAVGVEVKNEDGSKPADGEYKLEDDKAHNYVGPTKAALNLVYVF